jgi:hypothetical protein
LRVPGYELKTYEYLTRNAQHGTHNCFQSLKVVR